MASLCYHNIPIVFLWNRWRLEHANHPILLPLLGHSVASLAVSSPHRRPAACLGSRWLKTPAVWRLTVRPGRLARDAQIRSPRRPPPDTGGAVPLPHPFVHGSRFRPAACYSRSKPAVSDPEADLSRRWARWRKSRVHHGSEQTPKLGCGKI